ncbi:MAG TPA: DUF1361 domain-containing protein [Acidimicrobiia bacterium]
MTSAVVAGIGRLLDVSGHWMAWNLVLALVPWVLSLYLFRPTRRPGAAWACGALVCLLLVPNAPYILTDVIHLPPSVRREPSDAAVLLVVFPAYAALFAIGFGTYCDALRRLTRYMAARGWARSPWAVELPIHALSALAIYVGRIHRFNSWDLVQEPVDVLAHAFAGFTRPLAIAGIVVMFTCLTVGQAVLRILLLDRLRGATG